MEICIYGKMPKMNSYKTVSQFTKQLVRFSNYLVHNTIQRMNSVIGCFNVKYVEIFVEKIYFQLCGVLK